MAEKCAELLVPLKKGPIKGESTSGYTRDIDFNVERGDITFAPYSESGPMKKVAEGNNAVLAQFSFVFVSTGHYGKLADNLMLCAGAYLPCQRTLFLSLSLSLLQTRSRKRPRVLHPSHCER